MSDEREEGGAAVRVWKEREMTALSDGYKMCINYIYIYIYIIKLSTYTWGGTE